MSDTLSKCCGKPVAVVCGNEGTNHFMCTGCDEACDVQTYTQEKWIELSKVESRNNLGQLEFSIDGLLSLPEVQEVIEKEKREERDRIKEFIRQEMFTWESMNRDTIKAVLDYFDVIRREEREGV